MEQTACEYVPGSGNRYWPGIGEPPSTCAKCGQDIKAKMMAEYKRGHERGLKMAAILPDGASRQMWEILNEVLDNTAISHCQLNRLHGFHHGLHSHLFKTGQL